MATFYGLATPPTSYGGYGGNDPNASPKYSFDYPAEWKQDVINKTDKGTQGIDCRLYNPRNKQQQVFVITFGRAGEDNKSFRLTDIDSTIAGFAGADYDMQARVAGDVQAARWRALRGGAGGRAAGALQRRLLFCGDSLEFGTGIRPSPQDALSEGEQRTSQREVNGQTFFNIQIDSPDYLSTVTVMQGKVYACFVKSPTRQMFKADEDRLRRIISSFRTIEGETRQVRILQPSIATVLLSSVGASKAVAKPQVGNVETRRTTLRFIAATAALACWLATTAPHAVRGQAAAGSLSCWTTDNATAPLPDGLASEAAGRAYAAVNVGPAAICAIRTNWTLDCWAAGNDSAGLGADAPSDGVFIAVGVGSTRACAVDIDGRPMCWGTDAEELVPSIDLWTDPTNDTSSWAYLETEFYTDVAVGGDFAAWLYVERIATTYPQMHVQGLPSADPLTIAAQHTAFLDNTADFSSWNLLHVTSVAAAEHLLCSTTRNGTLLCWSEEQGWCAGLAAAGLMRESPLACANDSVAWQSVAVGGQHICGVFHSKTKATGLDTACVGPDVGAAAVPPTAAGSAAASAHQVATGANQSCVISAAGTATCWGHGTPSGELFWSNASISGARGCAMLATPLEQPPVPKLSLSPAVAVNQSQLPSSAPGTHGQEAAGSLFCWTTDNATAPLPDGLASAAAGRTYAAVAVGPTAGFAIRNDTSTLDCWAAGNDSTRLAADAPHDATFTAVAVSSTLVRRGETAEKGGGVVEELGNARPTCWGSHADDFAIAPMMELKDPANNDTGPSNNLFNYTSVAVGAHFSAWIYQDDIYDADGVISTSQWLLVMGTPSPDPLAVTSQWSTFLFKMSTQNLTQPNSVAAAERLLCITTINGTLLCWSEQPGWCAGVAAAGLMRQTPLACANDSVAWHSVAVGGQHVCGVFSTKASGHFKPSVPGTVCFGPDVGATAVLPTASTAAASAQQVATGANQSCVISATGAATCWGPGAPSGALFWNSASISGARGCAILTTLPPQAPVPELSLPPAVAANQSQPPSPATATGGTSISGGAVAGIVVGVLAAAVLGGGAALALARRRRRRRATQAVALGPDELDSKEPSWGPSSDGPTGIKVFRGRWQFTDVAVKVLLEAGVMAAIRHFHCLTFYGVVLDPAAIVTEFCSRGSLQDVLRVARGDAGAAAALTWRRRLKFALHGAAGMQYLHSRSPPIVHRDLKARRWEVADSGSPNLLIDENDVLKAGRVGDFNLSRLMERAGREDEEGSRSTQEVLMNPRWLAPEVLRGEEATPGSDVFAFGVVLWELLTWRVPWEGVGEIDIARRVLAGERLPVPPRAELPGPPCENAGGLDAYLALMSRCWAHAPGERPSFEEVAEELERLLRECGTAS
eukprot:scaffold9.g3149.t1